MDSRWFLLFREIRVIVALPAALLGLLQCGNNDATTSETVPSPPPPFESGMEGTARLAELGVSDVVALCNAYTNYPLTAFTPEENRIARCTVNSIFTAPDEADCAVQRDACLDTWPEDPCATTTVNPNCVATVDQLELCFTQQLSALAEHRELLACSAVGNALALQEIANAVWLIECREVLLSCPGIVLGSSPSPSADLAEESADVPPTEPVPGEP